MSEIKKYCFVCKKEKGLKSFKNTGKTEDGKFPYCKNCEWIHKNADKKEKHYVAHRLYRELIALVDQQAVGKTVLYFNKSMFTNWLFINPHFKNLHQKYYRSTDPTLEVHIRILDRTDIISFKNLDIYLSDEPLNAKEFYPLYDPEAEDPKVLNNG